MRHGYSYYFSLLFNEGTVWRFLNIHGKTTMLMKVMFKHERYESVIESTLIFWSLDRYAIHTGKLILVLTLDTYIYTYMKLMCPSPVIVTPLCKAPWEQISFQEPRIVGLWRQFYTILWNMNSNKVAKRDWKGFQCLTVRLETFLWLFKTFRNFLELLRPFWTSWDFLGFLGLFELKNTEHTQQFSNL